MWPLMQPTNKKQYQITANINWKTRQNSLAKAQKKTKVNEVMP
jgi:hypothetical protein